MNMDFGAYETPVEGIKKGAFGGTYFRHIYSGIDSKWHRKLWKEFDELGNIDRGYYCSNYYVVSISKYIVKCETTLRFWENKSCINPIDPYDWFQWYFKYWLGRRSLDDEREKRNCK